MRRTTSIRLTAVAIIAAVAVGAAIPPAGSRSLRDFDPDRLATLELGMWQAYYAKRRVQLFGFLVVTLREQYRFSWVQAVGVAFRLGKAAVTFGDATGDYDRVLPDLTRAFETIREHSHSTFDPSEVARLELAWWSTRRRPGQNAPEEVGRVIAQGYAAVYAAPLPDMMHPALLRAKAAALRDSTAAQPDWGTIRELLTASYRELKSRLDGRRPAGA